MMLSLVAAGLLALAQPAVPDSAPPAVDLTETARAINALMRDHHYNPAELDGPAYRDIEVRTEALGQPNCKQSSWARLEHPVPICYGINRNTCA